MVGISGVDTRALTRHLRERGAMRVGVSSVDLDPDSLRQRVLAAPGMLGADLSAEVSTPTAYTVKAEGEHRFTVAALDLGIKRNVPRRLAARGVTTHVLPASSTLDDLLAVSPDAVFFSPGPGDPATADHPVALARAVMRRRMPLFGICFGSQILGRALGFGTYKLAYGHRGINQPVLDRTTGKVEVTSHNHGFAVDAPLRRRDRHRLRRGSRSATCASTTTWSRGCARWTCRPSRCSTTRRRPPARTTPTTSSTGSSSSSRGSGSMPKRTDIGHVLVIGSGPIVIGQACEFDYSGTQACRVLRAEGLRVSLVNSNPATIMTDPEFADATYVEPITPEFVEKVIARERPDALLATLGGQTALNTAVALHEAGVLDKFGVELIGANIDAIRRGEDRQLFKEIVAKAGARVGLDDGAGGDLVPRSRVCRTMDGGPGDGRRARPAGGHPALVHHGRPRLRDGPHARDAGAPGRAPGWPRRRCTEVLIEESVLGWKEYELELMRDRKDNVVVVCSIENLDPMGVHTGDSVTVAPAMTLTDREYQRMRDLGIAVLREVGVDTGGCNIQFAVHPADRPAGRHRDEPAGVPLLGAGLEGDRVPDREDRREARHRLHPRRDPQRHHAARPRPRSSRRWTTWW